MAGMPSRLAEPPRAGAAPADGVSSSPVTTAAAATGVRKRNHRLGMYSEFDARGTPPFRPRNELPVNADQPGVQRSNGGASGRSCRAAMVISPASGHGLGRHPLSS